MIRCPQCDHFSLEGTAACERCGTALADAPAAEEAAMSDSALDAQVLAIAATGGKIAAIKWHREQTGLGLKESKDAVEALLRRHKVSALKSGCGGILLLAIPLVVAAAWLLSPA